MSLDKNVNDPRRGRNLPPRHLSEAQFESKEERTNRTSRFVRRVADEMLADRRSVADLLEVWTYSRARHKARRLHRVRPSIPARVAREMKWLCLV